MVIYIACILVLAFIFLGMSIPFSFLSGAMFYIFTTGTNMATAAPTAFFALEKASLLAIPLYMIAGHLIESSGIAGKLIDFAEALLKKVKGGMGATIPLASMFFGALCGSGTATVAAISSIMMPKMEKLGWDKRYIAALIAVSGPLGYMIPPNMNAIVFSLVADVSVAALFLATILPGILWGLLYMIINRFVYHKWLKPQVIESSAAIPAGSLQSPKLGTSLLPAIPAFGMPLIIMGGIYSGLFTATEAGAVSCIYAIIAGMWIYKQLSLKATYHSFEAGGKSVGPLAQSEWLTQTTYVVPW